MSCLLVNVGSMNASSTRLGHPVVPQKGAGTALQRVMETTSPSPMPLTTNHGLVRCSHCGEVVPRRRDAQRFCSARCRWRAWDVAHPRRQVSC